jgi:cytoskeletal protein RodZ
MMSATTQLPLDLISIRQRQGLSLQNISQITKIRISWLQAIEEGRWDELPGGIYRRSYLRQYAKETGISESELLELCPLSDLEH